MKSQFLTSTHNVRALLEQLGALRSRDRGVPALAAVVGNAGLGKTFATQWYATQHDARYLIANALWSPRWMLSDIYDAIVHGVAGGSSSQSAFGTSQRAYGECLHRLQEDPRPILIDEADRIAGRNDHLETLRDLSDRTGTPIVFVGTETVYRRLLQREVFASRLSQVVTFQRLKLEEIQMIARQLSDLDLPEASAQALLEASRGYFRDYVVGLSHLERAARSSRTSAPSVEMVTHVAAKALKRAA